MNKNQLAYDLYEKAKKYNSLSFKIQSILENIKIGNIIIANKQYNEIFNLVSCNYIPLLQNINQKLDTVSGIGERHGFEISVIVPFHNREKVIVNCIQTILSQSFNNIEIIAIDDGSNDDSYQILTSKIKDNRLKLIKCNKASGNSGTPRNIGLSLASGKYIAFVDSDDCIEPNFLQELHETITTQKAQIAMASNFKRIQYIKGQRKENIIQYKYIPHINQNAKYPFFINSFVIWDKLYERKLLIDNDIKFSESKIGADSLFVAKAYFYTSKAVICNNSDKYKYFAFAEGSVTKKYRTSANVQEEDKPYQAIFKWLQEESITDDYQFVQWIRRILSIAYCLKSGNFQINKEESDYLINNFSNAPFKSVITFLKKNNLHDNIDNVEKFFNLIKVNNK